MSSAYDYLSQSSGSNRSWLEGGSGSAIGGWALNALTGQRDYNRQLEMLGFENSFNAEQAQLARDFDERMTRESWARADSSYQRAVSDLKAAGLSPALALSVGGAPVGGMSGTSSAARSSSPTSQSSGQGLVSLISSVLGGFARIAATSINASSASNRAVPSSVGISSGRRSTNIAAISSSVRGTLSSTSIPKTPSSSRKALSKSTASHVVSIVICVHFIIYLPISSFFFCDLQTRMMFLPNLLQVWSQPMLPARIHSRYASVLQSASQEPVQPVLHNDHHAE